ncbi:MAG: hypothetical protein IJC09_07730 [Clostridia bacterium]|nr:hypothetical protein [Clostridia bacterium]
MSNISNQVSYLKGLAEGMSISEKSDEGKLIAKLIDVLSDAADEIDALWARNDELEMRIDELDEEMYAAEMDIDAIYDDIEGDADIDDYDDYIDDEDDDDLFDMYDDEDDDLFEIMCPECGEDVVVDFDMLDEDNNIVCPNCHRDIELEFDMDDDEDE